jgi:hypothetical protein
MSRILFAAVVAAGIFTSSVRANLIINGDFETGTFAPWIYDPGPMNDLTVVAPVPWFGAGSHAANGNFLVAFNAGNTPPGGKLSQTFSTTAGTEYTVQYDYGTTTVLPETADHQDLVVSVLGNNGITVLNSQTATASNPPSALTTFSFTFIADGSLATLQFFDPLTNQSFDLDGVLDNVSVEAIPEPASMALAGIGTAVIAGYALRRRKNRDKVAGI